MPKPDSLKYNDDGTYTITQENGKKQKYIPTDTFDNHQLLIIKKSGLKTWGIEDKELYPKEEMIGTMKGARVAVAVLDGEKLIGFAFGRDNGSSILDNSSTMTFDRVQKGDGPVTKLYNRIEVKTKNIGGGSTIIESGADKLSEAVINQAVAGIGEFQKFPVAEATDGHKSPKVAMPKGKGESSFLA